MFPTLSEAVTGERLTVGPPFFNKWMAPIGLALLLLTGIGAAAGVAQVHAGEPARAVPVAGGSGGCSVSGALVALGVRVWSSGICFALCVFVIATHRAGGLARRARAPGGRPAPIVFTAARRPGRPQQAPLRRLHRPPRHRADLPRLCRRRVQAGRAGAAQAGAAGHRRATTPCGTISMQVTDDGQKQMITGAPHRVRGRRGNRQDVPGQVVLPEARGGADDRGRDSPAASAKTSTSCMPAFDLKDQSASLHVVINPLVNWIWVGFGIMALGTGIALLPERAYSFAVARAPARPRRRPRRAAARAADRRRSGAPVARAACRVGPRVPVVARTPLEREDAEAS